MVLGGLARRLVASDKVSAVSKMEIWGGGGEGQCFWQREQHGQRPGGGREGAGILGAGARRSGCASAPPSLRSLQGSAVTGRTTSRWRRVKPSTASTASRCGGCRPSPGTWTPRTPVRTPTPIPTRAPTQIRPPKHPTSDPENKSVSLLRGLFEAPRRGCAAGGGGRGAAGGLGGWGGGPRGAPKAWGRARSSSPPGTPVGPVTQNPLPEAKMEAGRPARGT